MRDLDEIERDCDLLEDGYFALGPPLHDDIPPLIAEVRKLRAQLAATVRLTGASREYDHDHRYFCAECGVELADSEATP